jgi:hypothetical protein
VKHTLELVERDEDNRYLPPLRWHYSRLGRADSLLLSGRWHGDSLRLALEPVRVGTASQY